MPWFPVYRLSKSKYTYFLRTMKRGVAAMYIYPHNSLYGHFYKHVLQNFTAMKIDLNKYPLNVYNDGRSKEFLKSLKEDTNCYGLSNASLGQSILASFIRKASGMQLLSLIDSVTIGMKGDRARKCLAELIQIQINTIKKDPSLLLREAQINLMATSCVTDYLSSLESGSWENGAKNMGKAVLGLLQFKNPLNVIWESVLEISKKYDDICQVYHVAFLLNVYNTNTCCENIVKGLISETLCNDMHGESSFSGKKREKLFADVQYKTLEDNLKYRLNILSQIDKENRYLSDPFINWRKEVNLDKS